MAKQTVAVSGASGLVGTRLTAVLREAGHTVVAVSRRSSESNAILWDPVRGFLNPERLESVDAIVHLAGENIAGARWNSDVKKRIRDSRVAGTKSMVDSLRSLSRRPSTLVCASAIGFYGNRGDEVLDESSAQGTGFLADVCRDWEQAALGARELGIRVVCGRIGVVLSSKGGALQKMLLPFKMGAGGIVGSGRQYWSWIGLSDLARALAFCVETTGISGSVNLVSPHTVTNFDFTKTLGSVLRRPTIFPMPGFVAKIVLGEMAEELLLSSTRVTPAVLRKAGFQFTEADLKVCLGNELK
ncbi:MAG: TIGR01777 family oxidoreductase [Planctomycetaceae bacterium]